MYIYHHLGLGDHFICNGLVRYIYKKTQEEITLLVKKRNIKNVKRMFSDINLKYIEVVQEFPVYVYNIDDKYIESINDLFIGESFNGQKIIRPGHEKCYTSNNFDKIFYDNCSIPFEERWNSFHFQRDLKKEEEFFKNLNLNNSEYIFIHEESTSGNFNLNISSDIQKIYCKKNENEDTIFDWIYVIERAKEVHCINSSIIHLINSLNLNDNIKLYHHCLSEKSEYTFTLKNNWINIYH